MRLFLIFSGGDACGVHFYVRLLRMYSGWVRLYNRDTLNPSCQDTANDSNTRKMYLWSCACMCASVSCFMRADVPMPLGLDIWIKTDRSRHRLSTCQCTPAIHMYMSRGPLDVSPLVSRKPDRQRTEECQADHTLRTELSEPDVTLALLVDRIFCETSLVLPNGESSRSSMVESRPIRRAAISFLNFY